jgi:hypothetical protein
MHFPSDSPVRPIIFSPEMIRLIQAGEKTQTRRVVIPLPQHVLRVDTSSPRITLTARVNEAGKPQRIRCPHAVGDVLWIRESWTATFQSAGKQDAHWSVARRADRTERRCTSIQYEADTELPHQSGEWVSPIFMPRWAARLAIRIEKVRVEPLQDMSAFDVGGEGLLHQPVAGTLPDADSHPTDGRTNLEPAHQAFRARWNAIHSETTRRWASNPWVWVFHFTPGSL